MQRLFLRSAACILLCILFVIQQIYAPLITLWVCLGEYFHCVSYILLLELLLCNKGLQGLSVKTQLCFLVVYWFRYLDSFFITHSNRWILALKCFYMSFSLFLVAVIIYLRATWDRKKDTCSLIMLGFMSLVLAIINSVVDGAVPASNCEKILRFLRTASHYLQGFAMLPQFIFCYRDRENKDKVLFSYIIILGAYRLLYAINWIERAYNEQFFYVSGPMGLGILVIFLGDFICYKIRDRSCISDFVLRIDDTIAISHQPLLRGVYGEEYERLPPSFAMWASPPVTTPNVEMSVRNVQVIGKVASSSWQIGDENEGKENSTVCMVEDVENPPATEAPYELHGGSTQASSVSGEPAILA